MLSIAIVRGCREVPSDVPMFEKQGDILLCLSIQGFTEVQLQRIKNSESLAAERDKEVQQVSPRLLLASNPYLRT